MSEATAPVWRAGLVVEDLPGDESRAPIVLLHGLTFNRHTWRPVIAALRALDPHRRVLAIDLPGHGDSPVQPPHDLDHVADLVHRALTECGVVAPIMVGHSISGALVSVYASAYRAAAVINVDYAPDIEPFALLIRRLADALRGPKFDQVWQDVFAANFEVHLLPDRAAALVRANYVADQKIVLSYWRQLLEETPQELVDLNAEMSRRLTQRNVPYTLILGHDLAPGEEQRLQERLPHMRVLSWPGAGHFPHLARPEHFARLVVDAG